MKSDYDVFQIFIGNTFENILAEKEDDKRIILFQEWKYSVYEDSIFIELIELNNYKWKVRFSIWEMGKDTSRWLNPIEKAKWRGKINPTINKKEYSLTESEKLSLHQEINKIQNEFSESFDKGFYKKLKLNLNNLKIDFSWNEDKEIEDSIINLIKVIKNKT